MHSGGFFLLTIAHICVILNMVSNNATLQAAAEHFVLFWSCTSESNT